MKLCELLIIVFVELVILFHLFRSVVYTSYEKNFGEQHQPVGPSG